jgi:hypothetical protein
MRAEIPGHDLAEINHHMDLIHEAGFIDDGGPRASGPMFGFLFMGLSMNGHDFLDSVRSPDVWKRTQSVAAKVGTVSLSILVEIAKAEAKKMLGLP